jgi:hypothetical protein
VARLAGSQHLLAIDLEPLAGADMRALIAQAGTARLADAVADRIVVLADGNPFVAL